MELGTHVSSHTFAQKIAGAKCHDDAITVLDAIYRLPIEAQVLVIKCGRADCSPDYAPEGVGKEVPLLTKQGNPKKLWRNPSMQSGFIGYATQWQGTLPEVVKFHRSEWKLWREALIALHPILQRELIAHELSAA